MRFSPDGLARFAARGDSPTEIAALRRSASIPISELEHRRPLWLALSDLYLDTEHDWDGVAQACARSPYSIGEIQRILYDEVHPVVHPNRWSVAGVWQGFDEEWLVSSILARERRPLFRFPWPERRRYPWYRLEPLIADARRYSHRSA